jgi:hypothetical protein
MSRDTRINNTTQMMTEHHHRYSREKETSLAAIGVASHTG